MSITLTYTRVTDETITYAGKEPSRTLTVCTIEYTRSVHSGGATRKQG